MTDISDETPGIGDNSGDKATAVDGTGAERLRSIVERVERLEEERKAIGNDIKDIYTEAKSAGFDAKALRRLIADRKKDAEELKELESLLDVYRRSLGM